MLSATDFPFPYLIGRFFEPIALRVVVSAPISGLVLPPDSRANRQLHRSALRSFLATFVACHVRRGCPVKATAAADARRTRGACDLRCAARAGGPAGRQLRRSRRVEAAGGPSEARHDAACAAYTAR